MDRVEGRNTYTMLSTAFSNSDFTLLCEPSFWISVLIANNHKIGDVCLSVTSN